MNDLGRVRILLATHNGEKFLEEQLDSIANQTVEQINVTVSDDGSSDGTLDILAEWKSKWRKGTFDIVSGPCEGFAENFRSLILSAKGEDAYFAFSDQDDIWDTDKLETAIGWLAGHPNEPSLYCGRTRYVDESGRFLRLSPLFSRPPNIRNALVQSLAGANTMVLNQHAMQLVKDASRDARFVSHDWWAYIVVSGCGGEIRYDSVPRVDYRLHDTNVIGANDEWRQRLFRLKELLRGRFREWNALHLEGLQRFHGHLTTEAQQAIDELALFRSGNLPIRLQGLLNLSLYRQTRLGHLGLFVAIVHKKI